MRDLPKRLRLAGDGIEPEVDHEHFMKPEFAQHQKLMREAADEIERYMAVVENLHLLSKDK